MYFFCCSILTPFFDFPKKDLRLVYVENGYTNINTNSGGRK
ncbi:hypothetical protein DB29_01209 [Shouchella clausii]|nr:hypothetical protein DB29_01209 [Shouchella clausii]